MSNNEDLTGLPQSSLLAQRKCRLLYERALIAKSSPGICQTITMTVSFQVCDVNEVAPRTSVDLVLAVAQEVICDRSLANDFLKSVTTDTSGRDRSAAPSRSLFS